jgi:hypothetical protein
MKANELHIGGFYKSVKFGVPVRCELSDLYQLEIDCDGAEPDEEIIGRMFEPIHLTEEWLLKFGFEKKDVEIGYGINDIMVEYELDGYSFTQDNTGKWYLLHYNWNTEHFKYVHQLQNLYFALTGEELTIK